ncbi:MAG: carboxypeptidase-like regulatory domain-containing protein [Pirellulaceae bacterium]|nr:carboxypeptidase regulatory-like domain-containing protein [Planctomycetales bacterium]
MMSRSKSSGMQHIARCVLLVVLLTQFVAQPAIANGVLHGTVVNVSRKGAVVADAEVVLRANVEGQFVPVARTVTAHDGTFWFTGLPFEGLGPFLPGANCEGVHYPGPRIALTESQPVASATIEVFDTVQSPSPLTVKEHDIMIQVDAEVLQVRERLVIENTSRTCFVGCPSHAGGSPVTFSLGIPAEFTRVTFDKEAFGRRFDLVHGKLVTGIPWPPGSRELAFSYIVPSEDKTLRWKRTIDSPCRRLQIALRTEERHRVSGSVPLQATDSEGVYEFESSGNAFAVGDTIEIQLHDVPSSPATKARWGAIVALLIMLGVASIVAWRTRRPSA